MVAVGVLAHLRGFATVPRHPPCMLATTQNPISRHSHDVDKDKRLKWLILKSSRCGQRNNKKAILSNKADLYLIEKELHQLHLDKEALREILEGKAMDKKAREVKIRQKQADDDEFFMEFEVVRYDSEYESSD
ncbi:hypothetical protein Tco_0152893 [Tanacetum coccineum]